MGRGRSILLIGTVSAILLGIICLPGREVHARGARPLVRSVTGGATPIRIQTDITGIMEKVIADRPAVVVVDAGHGGNQPGCVVGRVMEKDINLSISLALKEELENRGIRVILTRKDDADVRLADRTIHAKPLFADYLVSIHCNAYDEDRSIRGFQCFYYQSEMGKKLSDEITELVSKKIKIRKAEEVGFQVLRESIIPATLIEVGYLTNYRERASLITRDYQRQMASVIAEGINRVLQS